MGDRRQILEFRDRRLASNLGQVLAPATKAALWCFVGSPTEFQIQQEDVWRVFLLRNGNHYAVCIFFLLQK